MWSWNRWEEDCIIFLLLSCRYKSIIFSFTLLSHLAIQSSISWKLRVIYQENSSRIRAHDERKNLIAKGKCFLFIHGTQFFLYFRISIDISKSLISAYDAVFYILTASSQVINAVFLLRLTAVFPVHSEVEWQLVQPTVRPVAGSMNFRSFT
jgi:hypothetical protein